MTQIPQLRLAFGLAALAVVMLGAPAAGAQIDPLLIGAIDIHTHPGPDERGNRTIDAYDYALLAKEHRMRGFVIKNHGGHTAALAHIVRRAVPGVEVFGMIALNGGVGGINPEQVRMFAAFGGGWGRIVSLPTEDIRQFPVSAGGLLLPEVIEVLEVIANTRTSNGGRLVLATGHVTLEESLLVVREGLRLGIPGNHILITHPMNYGASLEQMREYVSLGAFVEFTANRVLLDDSGTVLDTYAELIRGVGPEHVILSSELGRPDYPLLEPKGLAEFVHRLRPFGFTDRELSMMIRDNPTRWLDLTAPCTGPGC